MHVMTKCLSLVILSIENNEAVFPGCKARRPKFTSLTRKIFFFYSGRTEILEVEIRVKRVSLIEISIENLNKITWLIFEVPSG